MAEALGSIVKRLIASGASDDDIRFVISRHPETQAATKAKNDTLLANNAKSERAATRTWGDTARDLYRGATEDSIIAKGGEQVGQGTVKFQNGDKAGGLSDIWRGANTALSPATIPVAGGIAATVGLPATALALSGGYLGGKAAGWGARQLGATEGQANLAEDVANVVGGGLSVRGGAALADTAPGQAAINTASRVRVNPAAALDEFSIVKPFSLKPLKAGLHLAPETPEMRVPDFVRGGSPDFYQPMKPQGVSGSSTAPTSTFDDAQGFQSSVDPNMPNKSGYEGSQGTTRFDNAQNHQPTNIEDLIVRNAAATDREATPASSYTPSRSPQSFRVPAPDDTGMTAGLIEAMQNAEPPPGKVTLPPQATATGGARVGKDIVASGGRGSVTPAELADIEASVEKFGGTGRTAEPEIADPFRRFSENRKYLYDNGEMTATDLEALQQALKRPEMSVDDSPAAQLARMFNLPTDAEMAAQQAKWYPK